MNNLNNHLRLYPECSIDKNKNQVTVYGNNSDIGDVVLLQLYSDMQTVDAEPISIETLIGALEDEISDIKWSIALVGIDGKNNPNAIIKWLKTKPPLILGMSIPQGTLGLAQNLIKSIKKDLIFRNTKLVFGHAIPTFSKEIFEKLCPDSKIITGWGENNFVNFVKTTLGKDTKNTNNYQKFTIPIRIGKSKEFFRRIENSRGCGYGICTFCVKTISGPCLTTNIIDNLKIQLDQLKIIGDTYFGFSDEDFMGNPDNIDEFVKLIKPYGFTFSAAMRVETIVPDKPELKKKRVNDINNLVKSGLKLAFIGVESLVKTQQKRYGKHINGGVSSCIQAVSILLNAGCDVTMGMIIFDPYSTIDELKETANILIRKKLYKYVGHPFNALILREGSPLAKKYNLSKEKLNSNTLEYTWNFVNQEVGEVYKKCIEWWKPLEKEVILARNILRYSQCKNYHKIKYYYHDILKQTSIVLRKIVNGKENLNLETQKVKTKLQKIRQLSVTPRRIELRLPG